jgi:hypothetical protein
MLARGASSAFGVPQFPETQNMAVFKRYYRTNTIYMMSDNSDAPIVDTITVRVSGLPEVFYSKVLVLQYRTWLVIK